MHTIFPHDGAPDRMLVLHWPSGLRKSLPKIPADTAPNPSEHYPAVLVAIDDAAKLDARMREAASSLEPGGTLLVAYPKSGAKGFSDAPRRPDLLAALESHAFTLQGRNHPLNDSWTALCAGIASASEQEKARSVSKSKPSTKKKKDKPAKSELKVQSMIEPNPKMTNDTDSDPNTTPNTDPVPGAQPMPDSAQSAQPVPEFLPGMPPASPEAPPRAGNPGDILHVRVDAFPEPLTIAMRQEQTFYQLHERLRDALKLSTDTFAFLGGGLPIDNPVNAPPAASHRNAALTRVGQSPARDLHYCAGFGRDGWLSRYAIHIDR